MDKRKFPEHPAFDRPIEWNIPLPSWIDPDFDDSDELDLKKLAESAKPLDEVLGNSS